jgi:hypothetical protein
MCGPAGTGLENFQLTLPPRIRSRPSLRPSKPSLHKQTILRLRLHMTRIGQLYLQKGRWGDRQIVPSK